MYAIDWGYTSDWAVPPSIDEKIDRLSMRLSEVKRGSRELDEKIMNLVYGDPIPMKGSDEKRILHWDLKNGLYRAIAPHMTTSIDDAIQLIPDGFDIYLIQHDYLPQ